MLVLQAAANTGNPGEKQAAIYFNERAVRGLPSRTTSDLGHGQVGDKASGGWSIFIGNTWKYTHCFLEFLGGMSARHGFSLF